MKKKEHHKKPICGYPRLILFKGEWAQTISLECGRSQVELVNLKHWKGALIVTETGHCFKIKRIKNIKKITPWYLRGWFTYTSVKMEEDVEFCEYLSFDNVYPILWDAIRHATDIEVNLTLKDELINYTSTCPPEQIWRLYGGIISKGMRRSLEKQLESKTPLRSFFENIVLRTIKADQASAFL